MRIFDIVYVITRGGPGTSTLPRERQRRTPSSRPAVWGHGGLRISYRDAINIVRDLLPAHPAPPGEGGREKAEPEMRSPLRRVLDVVAVFVVALYLAPLYWIALTSIKPTVHINSKVPVWTFEPTMAH